MAEGAKRGPGRPAAPGEALQAARRRKETALADLRELEVKRRRGELLDADDVAREWSTILRDVRAGVLAVTSRVRARLPHLTAEDVGALDDELRQALAMFAEGSHR